jgi:hypothetical protein
MRKFIVTFLFVTFAAVGALGQSQGAPTLRIVSEDGNKLPSELMYGNTKVKPLRLRPGTNQPITIDDTDFFVQQQYVDFLSRFPDQGGFAFWQNEINSCGPDAACVDNKRVNVSAAFFLSIEYQESGYLVHRMYKAAFGDAQGQATIGGVLTPILVPVVRREEFMPDTRRIGQDVIVGTQGWPDRLNNNKNAFALEFVSRARFTTAFPATMTPAEFVDKLNANAGGVLDAGERQALVNELAANNTNAGRAGVLRKVAEDPTLEAAEKNKAFVLAQYFGYLKRNPNEGPDDNHSGYNFWLGKLNDNNGNFVQAQMVKAFIDSIEYRARF